MEKKSVFYRINSIPAIIGNKFKTVLSDFIWRSSNHQAQFIFNLTSERLRYSALHSEEIGISKEAYYPDKQLIVSLTSYGKRLYEVYLSIESIMQQTCKPNRIVLWLNEKNRNDKLPRIIENQQKRGLEVKYCKDVRSFTKLIPALHEYPDDVIITIDDDIIYHYDLVEELVKTHLQHQDCIICNRFHRMSFSPDGNIRPYIEWDIENSCEEKSMLCFPTGVGGVLYPPNSLSKEVFNEEKYMSLCPYADDVWFKAMAILNKTFSQPIPQHLHQTMYIDIPNDHSSLITHNVLGNGNDVAIKAVFEEYGIQDIMKHYL